MIWTVTGRQPSEITKASKAGHVPRDSGRVRGGWRNQMAASVHLGYRPKEVDTSVHLTPS
jgi:hypothetical protein